MKSFRLIFAALVLLAVAGEGFTNHPHVIASPATESQSPAISTYWAYSVRRWDRLITQEAERRNLDYDFLASMVWVESRGRPDAISPAGAVGLMQIMPREAGFSWRPPQEDLLNPSTNLFWGARTLSIVMHQGRGDVFSALAAYNAGWDRIHLNEPQRLATRVLREYAGAVAARHELPGRWVAYFAVRDLRIRGPIWVADSARDDVYFYGMENRVFGGDALIPMRVPTAILAHCQEADDGFVYDVGLWLYDAENGAWVGQTLHSINALMTFAIATAATPEPEPVLTQTLSNPTPPNPTPTPPPPTATPAPEDAPVIPPAIPCDYAPLRGEAWALHKENTVYGWKADVYAKGYGGNCQYTYAWNHVDEIKGGPMQDGIIFEVQSTRRDSVIVGTVIIQSGDEVVEVGVYVTPPD